MQEAADQSTVRTERTRLFLQALIVFCAVVAAELALATVDLLRPGLDLFGPDVTLSDQGRAGSNDTFLYSPPDTGN